MKYRILDHKLEEMVEKQSIYVLENGIGNYFVINENDI
jgi:hypothetical protein